MAAAALASAAEQYLSCDGVIQSNDDVEALHKARVAIRKLRSYLRTFRPVLDEAWAEDLRERLLALQDILAPVRDADVFTEQLTALSATLPAFDAAAANELLAIVREQKDRGHERLRHTMRTREHEVLLDHIARTREPRLRDGGQAACDAMAFIMQRALKSARKAVRDAGSAPSDAALHRIRIKSKHLRYAAESFACVAGAKARGFAKRVQCLQDMLGAQHDAVVSVERLRSYDASPPARFAAGELAILATERGRHEAKHWRRVWQDLCRKKNRFW